MRAGLKQFTLRKGTNKMFHSLLLLCTDTLGHIQQLIDRVDKCFFKHRARFRFLCDTNLRIHIKNVESVSNDLNAKGVNGGNLGIFNLIQCTACNVSFAGGKRRIL